MQITITEALIKLKTLESRINKSIRELSVTAVKKSGSDKLIDGHTLEKDFIDKAKSNYQRTMDLINQRTLIKSKIAQSNAKTIVTISGTEYTVTEAIDKKNNIQLEINLKDKLENDLALSLKSLTSLNEQAEQRANNYVETMLGTDKKNKVDEANDLYDSFYNKNKGILIDPISIKELISTKSSQITDFLDEVDGKLVISNSTTFIEI